MRSDFGRARVSTVASREGVWEAVGFELGSCARAAPQDRAGPGAAGSVIGEFSLVAASDSGLVWRVGTAYPS
jgi:hypothetical protein